MNKEIKSMLKYKKCTSDKAMKEIMKVGVVTGSYVFGGYDKKESDIDIILPMKYSSEIYAPMVYISMEYVEEEGYTSFYIKDSKKKIYNLLFMENNEIYNIWVKSTNDLVSMSKIKPFKKLLKKKQNRVLLFETMKEINGGRLDRMKTNFDKPKLDSDDIPF